MKYELGLLDQYMILSNKTIIENNPFLQVKFKEPVDVKKLHIAVEGALKDHPLFACTLRCNKRYYLETIDHPFTLIHCSEENRPMEFGDNTNGYLWQICYDYDTVSFEWCHGVSDGRGGFDFLTSIIHRYFGVTKEVTPVFKHSLESFYDKNEKGIAPKKANKGFKASDLPYIKRGYKTDCHILKGPTDILLSVAKNYDSTPAAIIPPLFSMALRKHINPVAKNRNVTCSTVIDCRKPMDTPTMHNCILSKNITYTDRFDNMDFSLVTTIYRTILDLAVQKENLILESTNTVNIFKVLTSIKPRFLQRAVFKFVAAVMKYTDSNFTFTYLGKINFPPEILDKIADFNFRSWTDVGECNIACVDFNDTFIINICENYKNKSIIPDFIEISKSQGILFEEVDSFMFEQASMRLKHGKKD